MRNRLHDRWRSYVARVLLTAETVLALLLAGPDITSARAAPVLIPSASCLAGVLSNPTLASTLDVETSPLETPAAAATQAQAPPSAGRLNVQPSIPPTSQPTTTPSSTAAEVPTEQAPTAMPPTPPPPPPPPAPPLPVASAPVSSCNAGLIVLINEVRFSYGLPQLVENPLLTAAAQHYAEFIAGYGVLSHTADGRTFDQRVEEAGYVGWTGLGENLAGGYQTAEEAIQGWLASEAHRDNILNPAFTETGFGCAQNSDSRYGYFWVEEFGCR